MKKYMMFIFLCCLFGCELIVDVDDPYKNTALVVNAIFTPDSTWMAEVSLDKSVLDDGPFKMVEDASVVIYQNGSPVEALLHSGYGKYRSQSGRPLSNISYEIQVDVPGRKSVRSTAQAIPPPTSVNDIELFQRQTQMGQETTLTIKFKDPSEKNYYQFSMEVESEFYDYYNDRVIDSRYPVGIQEADGQPQDEEDLFRNEILRNDVLFNGRDMALSFKTRINQSVKRIHVTMQSLTEDYYQYKTTLELQNETEGDPFAQPVNVYNNIEDGFGIFAGYSQSTYLIEQPMPTITSIEPMTGSPGDHIIIKGSNFHQPNVSLDKGQYPSYFYVARATENEIEAVVPSDAVTGKIIVKSAGHILLSDADFVVAE